MNIDLNLIAAAVDGWKVAAAGLAITLASGFLGHKLGRRPNAERERMLRAHIMSLSIDIADLIAKNHRDHDPKTGHFLPTHRTRPDVAASLKATADETRPSRVSGGAA